MSKKFQWNLIEESVCRALSDIVYSIWGVGRSLTRL